MTAQRTRVEKILHARAAAGPPPPGQEQPLVLMYVDAVGSAAYPETFGEFAGAAMLQRFAEVAENAFGEYQGRGASILDDAMVAQFPVAELAVRAGVELHRRIVRLNKILPPPERLQVRVAVHHGLGFIQEGEFCGDVMDTVAGIGRRCGPAQILISRKVRESLALDHNLHCNWLGAVPIAGEPDPLDLFEVVWTDPEIYAEFRQHSTRALVCGALTGASIALDQISLPGMPLAPWPKDEAPSVKPANGSRRDTDEVSPAVAGAVRSLESRYEILSELGKGGMGIVYKARDRETGDTVAIKALRPEVAADAAGMDRFKNELRTARRITHKNICRIYEFQRTEGSAYISMEYVEGRSLRDVLETDGKLPVDRALDCARQMCAGLREAHAENVVHRDLKPENIHLDCAGRVKILDFGIARFSSSGLTVQMDDDMVGTLAYMAPEQFEGTRVDHRADIYALGLILYEMFTGVPAFDAASTPALVAAHLHAAPRPPSELEPSIPPGVERAILKCLEKAPGDRFQSVEMLALALLDTSIAAKAASALPVAASPRACSGAAVPRETVALPRSQLKVGEILRDEPGTLTAVKPLTAHGQMRPSTGERPARAPAEPSRPPASSPAWIAALILLAVSGAAIFYLLFS